MAQNKDIIIELQPHGFIPEEIVEGDHYVLGGYSKLGESPVINPEGDWSAYRPAPEYQNKNGFESMNCSNYGTYNALETLGIFHKFVGFCTDFAERYSGVLTGTTPSGNSPHAVIEKIRTEIGGIPESALPFDSTIDTWEEYYSPNPMADELKAQGAALLKYFKIGHEWIFLHTGTADQKHAQLEVALTKGTVAVSVCAWKRDGALYFKEPTDNDNHWVQLLRRNPEGTWRVFDHYDAVVKDLRADYDFGFAKVYYLEAIPQPAPADPNAPITKKKWLEAIIAALKEMLDAVLRRLTLSD